MTLSRTVFCDNESAQAMAENNLSSRRTKHIWITFRVITDWINRGLVKLFHVHTSENLADFMTKVPKDVNYISNSNKLFESLVFHVHEKCCSFSFRLSFVPEYVCRFFYPFPLGLLQRWCVMISSFG